MENTQPSVETFDREFAPFDPTRVEATQPPEDATLFDEQGNPLVPFDEKYKEDFHGLLYLGALTSQFRWMGHTFTISTINMDDVLRVGQLIAPFRNTRSETRAYATAIVSMCVVTVDGQSLPMPIGGDADSYYQTRFNYVKNNWFAPVIDKIYEEYLVVEQQAQKVLDAMGKA